ncbi:MAG: DUF998 domain-containing protein [Candidatus Thorarchaeota archaeon]
MNSDNLAVVGRFQMRIDRLALSGYLFFIGGIQWFLGLLAAESWYPGYSNRIDYVSDLGVGPTAVLYNTSVFILGAFLVAGAYVYYSSRKAKDLSILTFLTGIGAMGVGVFTIDSQPMHSVFTLIAILFGSFSAIDSFRHLKRPMSYISLVLGIISIVSVVVFFPYLGLPVGSTETFLGMAKGSMERWAIYPLLAWIIGFGSHLTGFTVEK